MSPYGQAYGNAVHDPELSGRRAVCWWWYCQPRAGSPSGLPRPRLQGYRGSVGAPHPGWTVRVVHPRRRFGISEGKRGNKNRKTHRVRDQLAGIHKSRGEVVRLTRYLCGATSWQSTLLGDAVEVCAACELVYTKTRTVRIKR